MSTQDRKNFSKSSFQENTDHGKSGSSDVNVLSSEVYKSPGFISQIIAERKKQADSSGHPIHVNPKFLPLNQQRLKGCNSGKQELCGDTKSRYHYVNREFLQGNLQVQNSLGVPKLCSPAKQDPYSSVNSGHLSSKCSSDTKIKYMNKIEMCPDKDVIEKNHTNKNANISFKNLHSKSVYINPNFTRHMLAVKSGLNQIKNDNIKTCVNKVTQSVHVNPMFSHCQETLHSFRLEKTSCGVCKLQGKSHILCTHAVKETKHVFINPKLTVLNQQNINERSCLNVPPNGPEEIGSTAMNNVNDMIELRNTTNDKSTLHLLNAKPKNAMPPALKDVQQESSVTNVSDSGFGIKRLVHNSNISHALGITDTACSSTNVPRSSLVVLNKRKLIRCSARSAVKRTCEEQQTVVVLNTNRKLIKKRRTLSSSSRLTRNIESCSSVKLTPRLSPFSPPVKVVRSLRTKYKFVRNLSFHDKQTGMKNLGMPLLKSQKRNSVVNLSSDSTTQERMTDNSSTQVEKNGHNNSLILLSKTKLIRRGAKCTVRKNSKDHRTVVVSVNARKLVRRRRSSLNVSSRPVKLTPRTSPQVPSVKVARTVRTKYKYIRNLSDQKGRKMVSMLPPSGSRSRCYLKSKYNIDRRTQHPPRLVKNTKKRRVNYGGMQWHGTARTSSLPHAKRVASQRLFHKKPARGDLVWKNANYTQRKRLTGIKRRFQQIRRQRSNMLKFNSGGVSSMVRIGGVLYKCSVNKLTRTSIGGEKKAEANRLVSTKGHILHVRGSTFLMEPTGKTMRRIDAPSAHSLRAKSQKLTSPVTRVDIGGVTFLQKSQNVLIRTDYHRARNILSQAKQKSIATLTQKMKKNNQPCAFYQRFGKCSRKDKGCCPRVHDPKQIAVCKKFLQGQCHATGCTLSHDVVPEKMATCRFFLEGICVRDNCPYLHVKLNSKAGICLGFLQGYCAEGDKCQKRHINMCPDFDKLGKCSRGKFCPYPHKVGPKPRAKKRSLSKTNCSERPQEVFSEKTVVHRYYEDPSISKPNDVADNIDEASGAETCPQQSLEEKCVVELLDEVDVAFKRRKLETMPDYIAFK